MKTIVFAGPSLFRADISAFSQIEFRPPAASGDILAAIHEGAEAIGLIDGFYSDRAAVWHKEILYALSRGIPVLGAASMGALRAAECEPFGMIGIGDVFRSYRDGGRSSDADVAILHAPAELAYQPLTVALVDVEATVAGLKDMFAEGDLARLLEAARMLHFTRRTWKSIVEKAGLDAGLARMIAGSAVSVKQADALQLLAALADEAGLAKPGGNWTFQNTLFFKNIATKQHG
jgi:hypothetical protein